MVLKAKSMSISSSSMSMLAVAQGQVKVLVHRTATKTARTNNRNLKMEPWEKSRVIYSKLQMEGQSTVLSGTYVTYTKWSLSVRQE